MINIGAIISGWGKAMGLMKIEPKEQALSEERLKVCSGCEHATPSSCLEFINGSAVKIEGMYCNECFCPCLQKSLTNDVCRLGKWDDIKSVTN